MNNKFLRKTASQKEAKAPLEGQFSGKDPQALLLPINLIKTAENVRTSLPNIDDLVESVKAVGILQALLVAKTERGLELVAGRRRLEAARVAGLREVPVRVTNASPEQIQVLRLVENIQREDLSPRDEITAVAKLAAVFDGNQTELAKAIGKSKSYVSRCIKVAKIMMDPSCEIATANLSKSALLELAEAEDPHRLLQQAKSGTTQAMRDAKAGRKPSGALSGGRYVQQAIQFRQNEKTGVMSLRVNFSPDRTPEESRQQIIRTLEDVLMKLKGK